MEVGLQNCAWDIQGGVLYVGSDDCVFLQLPRYYKLQKKEIDWVYQTAIQNIRRSGYKVRYTKHYKQKIDMIWGQYAEEIEEHMTGYQELKILLSKVYWKVQAGLDIPEEKRRIKQLKDRVEVGGRGKNKQAVLMMELLYRILVGVASDNIRAYVVDGMYVEM